MLSFITDYTIRQRSIERTEYLAKIDAGRKAEQPPRIYSANWFRVDEGGKFIWPGFGENMQVLKWIIDRVKDRISARGTPLGLMSNYEDLTPDGLDFPREKFEGLFAVNKDERAQETAEIQEFLNRFGSRMPQQILGQYQALKRRLATHFGQF